MRKYRVDGGTIVVDGHRYQPGHYEFRPVSRPLTEKERQQVAGLRDTVVSQPPWDAAAHRRNAAARKVLARLYDDAVSMSELAQVSGYSIPSVRVMITKAREEGVGDGTRRVGQFIADPVEVEPRIPDFRDVTPQEQALLTAMYEQIPGKRNRQWTSPAGERLLEQVDALLTAPQPPRPSVRMIAAALGIPSNSLWGALTGWRRVRQFQWPAIPVSSGLTRAQRQQITAARDQAPVLGSASVVRREQEAAWDRARKQAGISPRRWGRMTVAQRRDALGGTPEVTPVEPRRVKWNDPDARPLADLISQLLDQGWSVPDLSTVLFIDNDNLTVLTV